MFYGREKAGGKSGKDRPDGQAVGDVAGVTVVAMVVRVVASKVATLARTDSFLEICVIINLLIACTKNGMRLVRTL